MVDKENKYEIRKFEDEGFSLDVNVSTDEKSIWLTQKDMSLLFNVSISRISRHIKNIFNDMELDEKSNLRKTQFPFSDKLVIIYSLNVILIVGHRVKSKRVNIFNEWVTKTLNESKELNNQSLNQKSFYNANNYEIVRFENGSVSLDINVSPDEDTVWLTQNDMASLFDTTVPNISMHISNIFKDLELEKNSVVKKSLTTASDGKTYNMDYYNLDMVLSVGYRINSKRGIEFRKWATSVLKQYLLKGNVINEERCLACTSNIISLQNEVKFIESKVNSLENNINIENSKIFYQGEILDAYTFIRKLFFLAKKEIIIVDFYADKFLLSMLSDIKTNITIITSTSSYLNKERIIPTNIKIINNDDIHGRYLFIDDIGYIIDNSFNNIGKKRLLMMKLEDTKELLLKDIL